MRGVSNKHCLLTFFICVSYHVEQGSHGQGKVSEKRKKFKVREKSGNFELSQGNWKFWRKSGKSQGIL